MQQYQNENKSLILLRITSQVRGGAVDSFGSSHLEGPGFDPMLVLLYPRVSP